LVTRESGRRHIVRVLDASTSPPKERYAVSNDNVNQLIQPGIFDDQLTEVFRSGARALLAKAVEAEVADPQHILHASRIAIATQTRVYLHPGQRIEMRECR
jgi:hypothetical protein